ncbi:MAG: type VI secretion system protein, partial [Acidobacteriota bacterium]|nr:type VI secretion system protein [Acidobacteriota bacterium]
MVLAAIAILVVLIVVLLYLLVRRRQVSEAGPAVAGEPGAVDVDFTAGKGSRLAAAFAHAATRLRSLLRGRDWRYALPWVLLLGETDGAKSRLLGGAGLNLPLGEPADPTPEEGQGCNFWFLDRGIVLDVSGDLLLRADGRSSDERSWRQLLALLQRYRPGRPLDGVVLALPARDLLAPEPLPDRPPGGALADEKAAVLHGKLRQAQQQLGLSFPVYILLTGCEMLTGFASFARELPEALRGGMLGWSSPYALSTLYQADWTGEAFDGLTAGLYRAQIEIFGAGQQVAEPDALFALPGELRKLEGPLRSWLGQIFKPSSYHEPLLLRGIYLCGAVAGEAGLTSAGSAGPAGSAGLAEAGALDIPLRPAAGHRGE